MQDDALNQGERNLRTLEEMKASEPQCTSPESIPVAKVNNQRSTDTGIEFMAHIIILYIESDKYVQ